MTLRHVVTLLAVSSVVVLAVLLLPDTGIAGDQLALFGFLAAPFKLIGKGAAAVGKVAFKGAKAGVKFVARTAPVIASSLTGLPLAGAPGGAPPDFVPAGGIVQQSQDFPVSDRFNLANTFEAFLLQARGEAQKLVERATEGVTVKPKLSGPLPVVLGIAGTVGVIGLLAGAVALGRR